MKELIKRATENENPIGEIGVALIVAMTHLEETRYSCLLYVSSATHKLPGIRRNTAETPSMENTAKIGISSEKPRVLIDRRLSVAPMMDWTDEVELLR
jgi:hypothetical protein